MLPSNLAPQKKNFLKKFSTSKNFEFYLTTAIPKLQFLTFQRSRTAALFLYH